MQTKTIDKLRELDDFIWGEEKENILESIYCEDIDGTELQFKTNIKNIDGNYEIVNMFEVSEKNLDELEFYGLKVILNEKPKLTREERDFLGMLEDNQTYIAREDNPWGLRLFGFEPTQYDSEWLFIDGENEDGGICLKSELFPFITWESGKAWSKKELMELEVMDQ